MNCATCNLFLNGSCNPRKIINDANRYCVLETHGKTKKVHDAYRSGRVPGVNSGSW